MGFWFCDGHQHGVSTQITLNLGKKFLRISCLGKMIAVTRILARVFLYLPFFLFPDSGLCLLDGLDILLLLIYFEWCDTKSQQ